MIKRKKRLFPPEGAYPTTSRIFSRSDCFTGWEEKLLYERLCLRAWIIVFEAEEEGIDVFSRSAAKIPLWIAAPTGQYAVHCPQSLQRCSRPSIIFGRPLSRINRRFGQTRIQVPQPMQLSELVVQWDGMMFSLGLSLVFLLWVKFSHQLGQEFDFRPGVWTNGISVLWPEYLWKKKTAPDHILPIRSHCRR